MGKKEKSDYLLCSLVRGETLMLCYENISVLVHAFCLHGFLYLCKLCVFKVNIHHLSTG